MPKEVTDKEGTIWNCVQAYAGLIADTEEKTDAARVAGASNLVNVVATPNGGAQTVRLQLAVDWEESMTDEDLIKEIESNQKR